ncbi:MAG: DUF1223 domain-containing protein [Pseudomonadota bacterium]
MRRVLQALAICLSVGAPVKATELNVVVVELYTSQGCSSCPPADEMVEVLAQRDDVIALSLHVDYWDYIGWKDEFADPKHSARQRGYATAAGRRSIYTPEMIVNGVTDIVGAKPMAVAMAIQKHMEMAPKVLVQAARDGDEIQIEANALARNLGPMQVHLVRFQPQRVAKITRGENAGRTIYYSNVAQDWQVIGSWDGASDLSLQASLPGKLPAVVLIQGKDHGPIRAAAVLR